MAKQRILLTGATGFVGPRLLERLKTGFFAAAEYLVWDYRLDDSGAEARTNIDICSSEAVAASVAAFRPTHVVHLAAQSHVPTSFAKPELTWRINVMGSLNLLEALNRYAPGVGVLYVSTSEVYGRSFQSGKPLDECALLQPQNPYAASKAAADLMCGQYAAQGLKIVRLRPFNHIGSGQREDFVASAFAAQIARIEAGLQHPVIKVGNLDAQRDFLAVDDVVEAYCLALEKISNLPSGQVLNICSGVPRKIDDLLRGLLAQTKMDIKVEIDPARMRPSDTPFAVGHFAAALKYLDWIPKKSFEDTLAAILVEWRNKVRSEIQ